MRGVIGVGWGEPQLGWGECGTLWVGYGWGSDGVGTGQKRQRASVEGCGSGLRHHWVLGLTRREIGDILA